MQLIPPPDQPMLNKDRDNCHKILGIGIVTCWKLASLNFETIIPIQVTQQTRRLDSCTLANRPLPSYEGPIDAAILITREDGLMSVVVWFTGAYNQHRMTSRSGKS